MAPFRQRIYSALTPAPTSSSTSSVLSVPSCLASPDCRQLVLYKPRAIVVYDAAKKKLEARAIAVPPADGECAASAAAGHSVSCPLCGQNVEIGQFSYQAQSYFRLLQDLFRNAAAKGSNIHSNPSTPDDADEENGFSFYANFNRTKSPRNSRSSATSNPRSPREVASDGTTPDRQGGSTGATGGYYHYPPGNASFMLGSEPNPFMLDIEETPTDYSADIAPPLSRRHTSAAGEDATSFGNINAARTAAVGGAGKPNASGTATKNRIPKSLLVTGYYASFFKEVALLGRGSFGEVYRCTHHLDDVFLGEFAIKKIPVGDDKAFLQKMLREVKIRERLKNSNIVDYKHSWLELGMSGGLQMQIEIPFLYVLMEFCNGGDLETYMLRNHHMHGVDVDMNDSEATAGGRGDSPDVAAVVAGERERRRRQRQRRVDGESYDVNRREGRMTDLTDDENEMGEAGGTISDTSNIYLSDEMLHEGSNTSNMNGDAASSLSAQSSANSSRRNSYRTSPPSSPCTSTWVPMPEHHIWKIFLDIANGLNHLHQSGILHRDLKPQNILIHYTRDTGSRQPYAAALLSDFGTSELLSERARVTDRQGFTGTIEYTAPELLEVDPASGQLRSDYDEKSDLWSLGMILFLMAFGTLPYQHPNPQVLRQVILSHQNPESLIPVHQGGGGAAPLPTASPPTNKSGGRGDGGTPSNAAHGSGVGANGGSPVNTPPTRSLDMLHLISALLQRDPAKRPSLDDIARQARINKHVLNVNMLDKASKEIASNLINK